MHFKVTLLSAPVSNELPFANVLRILCFSTAGNSPMPFCLSKSGKGIWFYIVLAIKRYINHKFSIKGCFKNGFQNLLISEKWIYLPKVLENSWFSFIISLARPLFYISANSDCKSQGKFLAIAFYLSVCFSTVNG